MAPAEVEAVLCHHPEVQEVAVAAVRGADGASALRAFVVPGSPDADLARLEPELIALARTRLAPFKVPKSVRLVRELPRTPSGKVRRFMLREES